MADKSEHDKTSFLRADSRYFTNMLMNLKVGCVFYFFVGKVVSVAEGTGKHKAKKSLIKKPPRPESAEAARA